LHFALRARERPGALAADSPELHGVVLLLALLAALGEMTRGHTDD
jgi:hypothetical protein